MAEEMNIGQLDENLILKILSLVPIKTAVSTSVLSKEWQSRWKSVPKLKFNSEDYQSEHQTFSETVYKSLLSYEAEVLDSFHLSFGSDKPDAVDVVNWIKTAFALHLRTLSLKTLHLIHAFYTNDESICNLLSGCPRLEELVVERSCEHSVKFFTIKVPSLQRLRIYDDNDEDEFVGYEEEVAIYLLKNARELKNAIFSTGPIEPGQLDKLKQRRRTRKKLDGVLKASNTCHLVFKFE
ncbi:hypothetical protein BRARA_D00578 [Brassica rapa]|uniref:FBD domain-containing protein n=1 Tax=Brassica campestris TaxID=3711 RepID=A0A397ZIC0_BRACM|nr:hypothetical protein BRARA_D00578 [Brassica rapa]